MTRVIYVEDELVMVFEEDLPAVELVSTIQAQRWQLPPALGARDSMVLRAVRLGRLVIVSPRAPRPGTPAAAETGLNLSRRQRQVLQGLADELTTKEIAAQLGLHVRTIEIHIATIKRRFGTTSRMQSVLRGVALGLCKIRPEPK